MKLLFTSALAMCSFGAVAQITWSAPVTVASNTYSNLHPRVVLDGSNNPLVLWGNSGSNKGYVARWNGTSFTMPTTVNPASIPIFAADWAGPDIASHGDTVYVVFKKTPETDTTNYTYLIRSFDGGQTFAPAVRIDAIADSVSRFPIVTTEDDGNPLVAFMKFDPGFSNARYVVTKSMDYGASFMPDVLASNSIDDVCDCCPASLLSSGTKKIMLYRNNASNIRTMYAGISTNNGASFASNVQVDSTNWMVMACPSSGPDGVIVGDTVYTAFMSQASGTARVYKSKMSISTGATTATQLATGTITGLTQQNYPRMASAGNAAAIVWKQLVSGTGQVSLSFTNSIVSGFPLTPDMVASGSIANADIAMSPGTIHVVWEDDNSGTVMYRKGTYTVTSVEEALKNNNYLALYPNPAVNEFSLSLATLPEIATCILIDNAGRTVKAPITKSKESITMSVKGLPDGQYYVLVTDVGGRNYYSKVLVRTK